jgi:hypothetical protein
VDSSRPSADCIDLIGDAQILLTAPFFPDADPLGFRPICSVPANGVLDSEDRLVQAERSLDDFLRGSLTFGNPQIDLLMQFVGTERFNDRLTAVIEEIVTLPLEVSIAGMLFPDGYGSVATRIKIPSGWAAGNREFLLKGFGPEGRDLVAGTVRDALLPALSELSDNCCPDATCDTLLPYFNQTYVAATSHPLPGRATLPDQFRKLIYPRSPAPITSDSPWADEFFFAGYAFSLLASSAPQDTLDRLEHLLLSLNVLYARMNHSASGADKMIRRASRDDDIDWLVALERRLRADYHALTQPTFSYDHHVLKLRDSLLHAWETDKIHERTDTLLQMARQAVERKLAEQQSRRVARVNLVVTILTIISIIVSVDAGVNLWTKLFG